MHVLTCTVYLVLLGNQWPPIMSVSVISICSNCPRIDELFHQKATLKIFLKCSGKKFPSKNVSHSWIPLQERLWKSIFLKAFHDETQIFSTTFRNVGTWQMVRFCAKFQIYITAKLQNPCIIQGDWPDGNNINMLCKYSIKYRMCWFRVNSLYSNLLLQETIHYWQCITFCPKFGSPLNSTFFHINLKRYDSAN